MLIPSLLAAALGCAQDNPVAPANHNPRILALTVFPTAIAQLDSAIVICQATDPDRDPLVYDWTTDARLIPKDARPGDTEIYNMASNSEVFYRSSVTPVSDTAWVRCYVRDHKGGVDSRRVTLILLSQ